MLALGVIFVRGPSREMSFVVQCLSFVIKCISTLVLLQMYFTTNDTQ
jgi:hypothetical protein